MHIVFDLQALDSPALTADPRNWGATGLRLALATARTAVGLGHMVSVVMAASDPDSVVCLRRYLSDLPFEPPSLSLWHPVRGASPWHRETNAELYRQLLGRVGADALVLDDAFCRQGHPLTGAPDWLPVDCSTVFLVRPETRLVDLPGDPAIWANAWEKSELALCAPSVQTPVAPLSDEKRIVPVHLQLQEQADSSAEHSASQELIELLRRLKSDRSALQARPQPLRARRLRLAYVSPLPPARTGIADYSADLIAAMSAHYDIDVVVEQTDVEDSCLPPGVAQRSAQWFASHWREFDRVLYHLGNSAFHRYVAALAERFPGAIVLHDFYLGSLLYDICERSKDHRALWAQAFYRSHGYGGLRHALQNETVHDVMARYPVNFEFLRHSREVIVHSRHACELAAQWLPPFVAKRFSHVPLLRTPVPAHGREARRNTARRSLGLGPGTYLVCCFGMVGKAKANLEILQAWLHLYESVGGHTELVFVGANDAEEYGLRLTQAIAAAGAAAGRIRITGWIDKPGYDQYLQAADVAVQLRTIDRGETSAAVLDCMNHGVATIVNSNGSMAELPTTAVCVIPADCRVRDIADAMTALHRDPVARAELSGSGAEWVHLAHAPDACAKAYQDLLETNVARHASGFWQDAVCKLADIPGTSGQDREALAVLSNATASTLPNLLSARQLLVDVSAIWNQDLKTGIQRVVRALLMELIQSPPPGWRIEPVYLCDRSGHWRLLYATQYAQQLLGIPLPETVLPEQAVEAGTGDLFLGLDFAAGFIVEAESVGLFDDLRKRGVAMHFVIYDLLPILRPEVFPQQAQGAHERWLRTVLKIADGVNCISHAVGNELKQWIHTYAPSEYPRIGAFHLGADVMSSVPSYGVPADSAATLVALKRRPTFLMVGTIEPRKGIAQALAAFELLWKRGTDVNLVLVGKPGWKVDTLVAALQSHPELGRRLFWLAGISDEYLESIYKHSSCLLAASEAEGFGLPLIEAAQKGVPILARDIPVFREVAGEHAFYFAGVSAEALSVAVGEWLHLYQQGTQPTSLDMPWLTWRESAGQLVRSLGI